MCEVMKKMCEDLSVDCVGNASVTSFVMMERLRSTCHATMPQHKHKHKQDKPFAFTAFVWGCRV